MRVIFVTDLSPESNILLSSLGADDRLVSYFYLSSADPDILRQLAVNGHPNIKEPRSERNKKRVPFVEPQGFAGSY